MDTFPISEKDLISMIGQSNEILKTIYSNLFVPPKWVGQRIEDFKGPVLEGQIIDQ